MKKQIFREFSDDQERPQVDDHEAKMARADLYKLAEYSVKLFKMIDENDELDGWVQAKITKASDYISSVYHYLEYEKMAAPNKESNEPVESIDESVSKKITESLATEWQKIKNQG
jgi:predicted RNA-binding protein with EMAP domain